MKKRLLSILLTLVMVIGLLPTTAFAASASTIYVGGKALDPGEYITGDGVISTTKPEDNYAYLQSDANEDYILTLHNFDHTGEGAPGNEYISGLITLSSTGVNLRLVLEGTSTLTKKTGSTKSSVYGVYFERVAGSPKLTIAGSGTLNINTDTGIHVGNSASFEMESGTINIKANQYGYQDDGYSKTIKINGNLNIESGYSAFAIRYPTGAGSSTLEFLGGSHSIISDSCAFYVLGNVIVKGGSLVAKSKGTNPVADSSTSISAGDGIEILASTNVDGTGAVAYKAADKSTYKYLKIEAAPAPTPEIWVGGVGMVSGQYLDESGNVGTTALSDNYAYYEEGVLTLKNYDYTGAGISGAAIYRDGDLTIELYGTSDVECTNGIGIDVQNGALTVSGAETGSKLKVSGNGISGHGIRAYKNLIFTDADVEVTSASGTGIVNSYDTLDDTKGYVTVSGSSLKVAADIHGIYTRNGYSIDDSNVEVNAGSYGLYVMGGNTDSATTDSTLKVAGERGGININYRASFKNSNAVIKCTRTDDSYDAIYFAVTPNDSLVVDNDLTVLASTDPAGSNPETYDAAKNSTYDWIKISGASISDDEGGNGDDPDPAPTATIQVKKVDENNQPLAGAVFAMESEVAGGEDYTATSDANGIATFTGVKEGSYNITETTAPAGYQLDAAPRHMDVNAEGKGVYYTEPSEENPTGEVEYDNEKPFVFVNELYKATFYVTKTDGENRLAGASFKLENTVAGRTDYTATSDETGKVNFTNVVDGEYILSETAAPDGYTKSDNTVRFKVERGVVSYYTDRWAPYSNTLSIANTKIPTATISFTKTDAEDSGLAGAVFHLTEEGASEPAYEATSDDTGLVSFEVVSGTYILSEYSAPDGYVKTEDTWMFKVDTSAEDGRPVQLYDAADETYYGYEGMLIIENEAAPVPPVTIEIPVTKAVIRGDSGNTDFSGSEIFEFEVEITNSNVEEYTVEDNTVTVTDMNGGSTTIAITVPGDKFDDVCGEGILITEVSGSAEGWTYDDTEWLAVYDAETGWKFTVYTEEVGPVAPDYEQSVTFTNTYTENVAVPADIVIKKTDGEGAALPGAEFVLENDSNEYEATSDEAGLVTFENVTEGYYTLTETVVPEGYTATEFDYSFSVNASGAVMFFDGTPGSNGLPYDNGQPQVIVNEELLPVTIEIPVYKALIMGGDVNFEGEETFTFEVEALNSNADAEDFTVENNSITFTDDEVGSTTIRITIPGDQYDEVAGEGFRITEKSGSAEGWEYDDAAYVVLPDEDGWAYYMAGEESDVEEKIPLIYFINTYTEWAPVTIQIPFTKEVKKGGMLDADETEFTFELTSIRDVEMAVVGTTVTTDGVGTYEGLITVTIARADLEDLMKGLILTEQDDGEDNWTYDDTAWWIQIVPPVQINSLRAPSVSVTGYTVEFYETIAAEDGGVEPDYENGAVDSIGFTNTYTENLLFFPVLNKVDHMAFLEGYEDGTFRPDRSMTRAEVTAMFARLLTEQMEVGIHYGSTFTDVPADAWYADYIGYMEQFGVINGYPDGTFRPDAPITRAEFAAIACRFEVLTQGYETFKDVPADHWAAAYISYAASRGWVEGYEDGTFRPSNNITRAEVAAVTCRMLERSADQDYVRVWYSNLPRTYKDVTEGTHWAFWYVMEASNGHDYTRYAYGEDWYRVYK